MTGSGCVRLCFSLFHSVCSLKEQFNIPGITGITHTCPESFFTSSFGDTYRQCLQYCWRTTRCTACTWIPRSSVCRLRDGEYSVPPETPVNTSCLFTEASTKHLITGVMKAVTSPWRKHHPCQGRPCDAAHTCAAVEAASNFICLSVPEHTFGDYYFGSLATRTHCGLARKVVSGFEYMGCYPDDPNRMLKDFREESDVMTRDWCLVKCREGNYTFAGLEHYTHCFCGDSYDESVYPKKAESECNTPCTGNPQQMCGGWWRLSVFICR